MSRGRLGLALSSAFWLVAFPASAPFQAAELFPAQKAQRGWQQFSAAGFSQPACGVVYRLADRLTNGMPLGGIDTGCVDLESNGTFGYCTLFNTLAPRRGGATVRAPILALCVDGKTWALGGRSAKGDFMTHLDRWLPADLGASQPAWVTALNAVTPPGIAGWAKSRGLAKNRVPAGKVFCHTPTYVQWTSPIAGEIEIGGGLWLPRNLGRIQKWELRRNGFAFRSGQVAWGPTAGSPQPYTAKDGTATLRLQVAQGDRIELMLERGAVCEDFVGVDLRIAQPGTAGAWDLAADWSDSQNPHGVWRYGSETSYRYWDEASYQYRYLFERGAPPGVKEAREIYYWGHYPVADLEYETDAPVQVGLRAWSPFIPGSCKESAIPGAVFEVHLRNATAETRRGLLAFSFPGPSAEEAGSERFSRSQIEGDFTGLEVKGPRAAYALGVFGKESVRRGGDLGADHQAWANLAQSLPAPQAHRSGSSVAVEFSLAAGQEKVIRFALTWVAPEWNAAGANSAKGSPNIFSHMYAKYYPNAIETAKLLAANHQSLLKRILAWQQVVYTEQQLPLWLRDSLINNLYMITETGLWAQAKRPLGKWVRPEDGLFGMNECPRECPQTECIPCSLYGNLPVVYFFPELVLSTLRGYQHYQYPDDMVPWIFGSKVDFASPAPPYQVCSSDVCLVEIIDKLWLRTGDDNVVKEFYDAAKRATIHTMNLRPDYGDRQVISMPTGDKDMEWIESVPLRGLVSHVGGIHLAQLRMVRRMAEKMGDQEFVKRCDRWYEAGSKSLEDDLWAGTHYLLYNEFKSGKKSPLLLSCQLDGQWIAQFHGLPGVFPPLRVKTTLDTIAKACADPQRFPYGVKVFGNADGSPAQGELAYWRSTGVHVPSVFMLGMTYIYSGRREIGEDAIRRIMDYVVVQNGYTWDFPLVWDAATGSRWYGSDYYQNMMLWSVPAVLAGNRDLAGPCRPGGLVARMIQAGNPHEASPVRARP